MLMTSPNLSKKENVMEHTHAFCNAVNQLHQEADGLSAVASFRYNAANIHDLEHVHAAHLQSLLHGFATRLRTLAHQFEEHAPQGPVNTLDYSALYETPQNTRTA